MNRKRYARQREDFDRHYRDGSYPKMWHKFAPDGLFSPKFDLRPFQRLSRNDGEAERPDMLLAIMQRKAR